MATKVGPAAVSYGIGVQNRYSAFLDDDDGFAMPASIMAATTKRIAEMNKQKASVAVVSSKPINQSSHNNNPSGGGKSGGAKSASSNKQSEAKGTQQNDFKRNETTKRGQQQQKQAGQLNQGANNSVQSGLKQHTANSNGTGNDNKYHGGQNGTNNKFSRTSQFNGPNRMANRPQQPYNLMNKENNDESQQQGKSSRQNNQRSFVKRPFNQGDQRRGQPLNDDGVVGTIGASNEDEKRRRQQKRALDMKHKDPEKREAKRQQSTQAAQSAEDGVAVASTNAVPSPGSQGPRNGKTRRQFNDGERPTSDETGRNPRGGPGVTRVRGGRPDGENGGERRENGIRGPRADRPQRNRNGFGQGSRGSRGSRGDEPGKFGSEKQRPIPNFSDKSDFPSLAS